MTHQSHQNPESPLLGKKNLPGLSLSLYPYSMGLIKLSITFINMIYCRSGDFHLRMTSTILVHVIPIFQNSYSQYPGAVRDLGGAAFARRGYQLLRIR